MQLRAGPIIPNSTQSYPIIPNHSHSYPIIAIHTQSYPIVPNCTQSYPIIPNHTGGGGVLQWFSTSKLLPELAIKVQSGMRIQKNHGPNGIDGVPCLGNLGVVPQKQPSKRPSDASSFMELHKKHIRKEARK